MYYEAFHDESCRALSKKISNDLELKQSDPTSTKYINCQQFTKGTRGKPNEQLFPKQVVIQLPKIYKYVTNIIAEPKYKYGQQEQVTVRKHNKSTALERSVLNTTGGGGLKPVLWYLNLTLSFCFITSIINHRSGNLKHKTKHLVLRKAG